MPEAGSLWALDIRPLSPYPLRMPARKTPKPPAPVSVGFISLGCAKNLVDSQIMAGSLLSEGVTLARAPEESDVVIINTCSFIDAARQESIETILSACELKKTGPCRAVLVTGCLPQRYREDLHESLPEVDAFIGLDELEDVGSVVRRLAQGEHGIVQISPSSRRLYDPRVPGVVFTGGPYAYLKIAEGCDHRCAFCAIPSIRGAYRSLPVDRVVREAGQLLERGFVELNLISQDVTYYGRDLNDGGGLPALLRALGRIGGKFWIRLLYGYPSHVTDALIEAIADVPQVVPYLDVPIQHSHPDMLRAMRRANTVRHVAELPARLRAALPDVALRTTCLLGFPGETEQHFEHLLRYAGDVRFDHLGAFVFSPEEDTPAFDMSGPPSREEAEERRERLLLLQQDIVAERTATLVGEEADLLLEQPSRKGATWVGRTARQAPEVDGETLVSRVPRTKRPGEFIRVRYTSQSGYDMRATALASSGKRRKSSRKATGA